MIDAKTYGTPRVVSLDPDQLAQFLDAIRALHPAPDEPARPNLRVVRGEER